MAGASAALAIACPAQATTYVWSSGDYMPGTTSPSPLLSGDVLSIQTTAAKTFASNFTNQSGEVDMLDGILGFGTVSVTVTNNALWRVMSANATGFSGGTFVNTGIFRNQGGGDFSFNDQLVNNGTLDAAAGTISYKGGLTFNSGTIFTGTGINRTISNAAFNGAISSTNLVLDGGTATGTGITLSGTASFASGSMAGDWTIANGSTLAIIGTSDKGISGSLINNGTVEMQQGFLSFNSANVVNNNLRLVDSASDTNFSGGTLFNNGILRNAGTGVFRVRGGFVNNGIIDAATGYINFKAGVTFNSGTIFTGAGTNQMDGSADFIGAISSTNLRFNSGAATGTGAVLSGSARLTSGGMAGDWTIANGSTFAISGGGIAGNFTNNGTVEQQGFLQLNSANVVNDSLWLVDSASTTNFSGGTLVNNGILRNAGTGDFLVRGGFVNNGTIDAAVGTINYKGGITFNSGTIFTGSGVNETVFDATFNGAISSTNLLLNGGNAIGNAAVLSGTARLASGGMSGDWTITDGSTLAVTGGGISGNFTNDGTVDWSQGNITLSNGMLTNTGTMKISGASGQMQGVGIASLVNRGLVTKTGSGTTAIGAPILNYGTIDVEEGSLTLPTNTTNFGTIEGIGTVALAGTLTNAGEIAPGAAGSGIGALTLQGGYAQTATGILDIQLGAGGTSDIFRVAGAASLDGTLALYCAGCSVNVGDIFTILDPGGALTGRFASTTATGFYTAFAYTVLYDNSADPRVQVRVDNVGTAPPGVPEPATWAMLLIGFGFIGGALRQRGEHRTRNWRCSYF